MLQSLEKMNAELSSLSTKVAREEEKDVGLDGCCVEWFLSQAEKAQPLSYDFEHQRIVLWSTPHYMRQTSYGAYLRVWPSAPALAKFLVDRFASLSSFQQQRSQPMLELGAGVGFCSIAVSLVTGCSIIATDGDLKVFSYLQQNCQQTHDLVRAQLVRWGDDNDIKELKKYAKDGFHYIFGADVVYQREAIPLLVSTIHRCLVGQNGVVVLAFSRIFESFEQQLLENMEKYAFQLKDRQLRDAVFIFSWEKRVE